MTTTDHRATAPGAYLAFSARTVCEVLGLTYDELLGRMSDHGYTATSRGAISNIFSGKRPNTRARRAIALAMGFRAGDARLVIPVDALDGLEDAELDAA